MEKDSRRKRHRESTNDDEEGDYSNDEEESYENTVQRPFKQRRPRQQEQGPHGEESRQEPELPVAPTLDEFRQDPNLYRPRREWFRCSSRNGVGLDSSFFIPEVYFGEEYDSALHNCIRRGHVDAAQKLILEGPPRIVQVVNRKGVSPVILAAQNGHLALVKLLLEHGANILHVTRTGSTAVLQAAHFGHLDVVKLLVGINKDLLERCNQRKTTPLMRACQENHLHVVKFLCEQGVRVNEKNLQGMTALMLASQRGNAEICDCLTQRGADLNAMTEQASTSLILACKREHLQTVEVLVRAGAELYIKDGKGRTARDICLHRSIRRRHASNPEILQKLIAVLDPSAQVDLMRLQARKDRSFSWIRTWTLLQDDRARLRGLEDQPFHVAVGMAERCCMFSPASMAWFRMLALPAPLVSHIAGFCPLPNHFYRRLALLLDRCTHDANSALVACFDIVDEVLEERGFLVALDEALIPPPSHYPSWVGSPARACVWSQSICVLTSVPSLTFTGGVETLSDSKFTCGYVHRRYNLARTIGSVAAACPIPSERHCCQASTSP